MTPRETPVLVVYFNRPTELERTLRALAAVEPAQLFFASDGPRAGRPGDAELIAACHEVVRQVVTWDCDVRMFHADANYGCDGFVPRAIDWFFSEAEHGIILEDDCLISDAFVGFATELLQRYKDNARVMNISAANFQSRAWGNADYYFSRYPMNWGWATWRRAWERFDTDMPDVEETIRDRLDRVVSTTSERRFWARFFRGLKSGRYTFWDAKWVYAIWRADGVSITPNRNLVSNIGYGANATHTSGKDVAMEREIAAFDGPLVHPAQSLDVCAAADRQHFRSRVQPPPLKRVASLMRRLLAVPTRLVRRTGRTDA